MRFSSLSDSFAQRPQSPYALDRANAIGAQAAMAQFRQRSVFFDGVLKGDYSLAIVNRHLARGLLKAGVDLTLYSPEEDWQSDAMLNQMQDIRARCITVYPTSGSFDVHLRNTWPPKADDMVGGQLNAYVCFAWEELKVPEGIIDHFNTYLDIIMVTSNFVEQSLRHSGLTIPLSVVGNGTDHLLDFLPNKSLLQNKERNRARIIHVSSCFPRKGVDVLIDAFTQTFKPDEPVELVIKTFDNPHNTVDRDLARTGQERGSIAPINVIKRSMSYPELAALISASDLLAAPSRGEGFGLPLAEALLLGIPAVTTGYSGQTDFCTDQTAWLVGYRMVKSEAHVTAGTGTAEWAEPDASELGHQMRRALSDKAASYRKVRCAQKLLTAHFKWEDVVRRVAQSVEGHAARDGARMVMAKAVTIDLVSPWSQVCGIATYSEHLFATDSLRPALRRVLAREQRDWEAAVFPEAENPRVEVARPWGYNKEGILRLKEALGAGKSHILWIQHHPGFFSEEDMNAIAPSLRLSGYALKAITLHNVRETLQNNQVEWLREFNPIFVHTVGDAEQVLNQTGIKTHVIPHGILLRSDVKSSQSDVFTVGTFGFLYPHKNIPLLVEACARALPVLPSLRLKILTCVRADPRSWVERARVETLIAYFGIGDVVERDYGFLPDEAIIGRLSGCDLLCFPYGESGESATGAVRIALAADRPLLCSSSSVMGDVLPQALVLSQLNGASIAEALIVLAKHPDIRGLRDVPRRQFVARHGYESTAERHMQILRECLKERIDG